MIAFIKNNNVECIKKKLILLYVLNVTDIIFTILLLQTGYFTEVNFFMAKAVQNPAVSILIKIILPAIILLYIFKRMELADSDQRKASNIAVNISLSIYSLVNLSHVIWIALLTVLILKY